MNRTKKQDAPVRSAGMREVFAKCIHVRGKTIYPRSAKVFHFFVREKAEAVG